MNLYKQKDKEIFGREKEISYFYDTVTDIYSNKGHNRNLNSSLNYFNGISGIGKSTLCDFLIHEEIPKLECEKISAHIDMNSQLDEFQTIRKMYYQLKKTIPFVRYELASKYLALRKENKKYDIEKSLDGVETIFNCIKDLALALMSLSAIENVIADTISSAVFSSEKFNRTILGLNNKFNKEINKFIKEIWEQDLDILEQNLTKYFVQDINLILNNDKSHTILILTIDAFEKRVINNGIDWILQNEYLFKLNNTVWMLFGTEKKLRFEKAYISKTDIPIGHFNIKEDEEEALLKGYLIERGVSNEDDCDFIINFSQGHPATISMLLELRQTYINLNNLGGSNSIFQDDKLKLDIEKKGYPQLFERYFGQHLSVSQKNILKNLVLFDKWDTSIFNAISSNHPEITLNDFEILMNNSALIEELPENRQFKIIDIVGKSLLSICTEAEIRQAYKCKFIHYKTLTDEIYERLKANKEDISLIEYKKLSNFSVNAFESAVHSYINKCEFELISKWCTKIQQFMSTLGLYHLKVELISIYLYGVEERDNFIYDSPNEEKKRYKFQSQRDLCWALRGVHEYEKSLDIACQYHLELIKTYSISHQYIPFSFYLIGLIFNNIGEYENAEYYLNQCIEIHEKYKNHHLDTSEDYYIVATNVKGCNALDIGNYLDAETCLVEAESLRTTASGRHISHLNLSKLYYYRACSENDVCLLDKASEELDSLVNNWGIYKADVFDDNKKLYIPTAIDKISLKLRRKTIKMKKDIFLSQDLEAQCLSKYIDDLDNLYLDFCKLEQSSVIPYLLVINNNKAVLYALQGFLEKSKHALEDCLTKKKTYFQHKKKTVKETEINLNLISQHMRYTDVYLNPNKLILQYI